MIRPAVSFCLLVFVVAAQAQTNAYLDAAKATGVWLRANALVTPTGTAWPADPRDSKTVSLDLYSGAPGVVLYFLEAAHATKDASYLKDARAGADYLAANVEKVEDTGLYTGLAGVGFVLWETHKATKDDKYRRAAFRCVQLLAERAKPVGAGVEWNGVNDIIAGSAGTGLFLLYAAREMRQPALRELAAQAGRRLLELGKPENGGTKWAMDKEFPRLMPNFSHGTAGVAYFLATLYRETKEKAFLDAALSGARYLQSVAANEGDSCLIFHHEPDGKDLFYLGWCHGPAGTARLFYRLAQITGRREWQEMALKNAHGIVKSGIPEKQTPGFWNNVSQCCGSAGVADFFLNLYRLGGQSTHLAFARRMTDDLLGRATREGTGLKWVQAENRRQPDLLVAQTGYMQGAAGIGILLFRFDSIEHKRKPLITFPDTPF